MLFSSIPFIYCFLPCVLIMYFIAPRRLKNLVLLVTSLVFYGWGEPVYLFLMLASVLVGYASGILIEKYKGQKKAEFIRTAGVLISFSFLGYFKYADFFIESFNSATGLSVPLLSVALPIGISFYTFQISSYIIDVYKGDVKAQKSFVRLACYVTMFSQLIAGPIVRYSDIAESLAHRTHSAEKFSLGVRRFAFGLAKKILLANQLGEIGTLFRESQEKSTVFFWLYAIAYSLQIYFDFSGYSDMAIGLGHFFGFSFNENFNYPFISKSITEFWRRWHITLGSWFRDYVYIPLGGNKVKKSIWLINILVVWAFTGLWHGADWNFVIWGVYFSVFLVLEKLFLLEHLKKSKVLSRVYLLFFVLISFIIFNSTSLAQIKTDLAWMFCVGDLPFSSAEAVYYLKSYAVLLVVALIGATPLCKNIANKIGASEKGRKALNILEPVTAFALILLSTAYLVDGSFNPFLYFRF